MTGRPPQTAAATRGRIRAAWRRAGHRGWTLRITFSGPPTRRAEPCYRITSMAESPISHFTVFLGAYAAGGRS